MNLTDLNLRLNAVAETLAEVRAALRQKQRQQLWHDTEDSEVPLKWLGHDLGTKFRNERLNHD